MNDIGRRVRDFIDGRQLFIYFTVTFLISWICWAVYFHFKSTGLVLDRFWLIAQIGVFAPSITAIVFCLVRGENGSSRRSLSLLSLYSMLIVLGIAVAWYGVIDLSLLPGWLKVLIILAAATALVYFLLQRRVLHTVQRRTVPKTRFSIMLISSFLFYPVLFIMIWALLHIVLKDPRISILERIDTSVPFLVIVTAAFDFLFGGSVGEETGWRGFALPLLLKRHNALKASLILGVIWALWHLPIDLFGDLGYPGTAAVVVRFLLAIPMSIIFTWFYIHTRYGVVSSMLLHSGVNIIPALGFSNYEVTFGILIMLQIIIASVIVSADGAFQGLREQE